MNKNELKKNVGYHVKLRPMAKRFAGGRSGPQLPPVDDDWLIQTVDKTGIRISNSATGHGTVLGFDHIREFTTDPVRGQGYGLLILKTQLHIGGRNLWTEPITPGLSAPDPLQNVQGWKRVNDAAYLQRLSRPAPVMPQGGSGNQIVGIALLACLFIGVGLLAANA